jgi:hypothetical protein
MGGREIRTYDFGKAGRYILKKSISQSDIDTFGSLYLVYGGDKSIVAKGNTLQDIKESFRNYVKKERIDLLNQASKLGNLELRLEKKSMDFVEEYYYQTLQNNVEGGN